MSDNDKHQPIPAPRNLYDLISQAVDDPTRPVWFDADRLASDHLGTQLAREIRWAEHTDEDGRLVGILAGDDRAVTLRYQPDWEPGTACLQVQVPCPEDPACPGPAWDVINSRHELLGALEGSYDDPTCTVHHPEWST